MDIRLKTKAQKIIEIAEGKICNHCLGRKFSQEMEGPGNELRGIKIRSSMGANEKTIPSEHSCFICGCIFQNLDSVVDNIETKIKSLDLEFSSFLVGSVLPPEMIQKDEGINEELDIEVESIKKELNREIGKILEKRWEKEVNFESPNIVIMVDFKQDPVKVRIQINPLFLEGRYRKLIRGIPQTKWPCRKCKGKGCEYCNFTGKMYSESVEELVSAPVLDMSHSHDSKFHGAGREDIDVKMLGTGRPFVLEMKEPRRRRLDLDKLHQEINKSAEGKVEVLDLKYSFRSRKAEIKTSSPDTYKVYQAFVELEDEIDQKQLNDLQNLHIIKQRTPIRVSHRRADKIRTRKVLNIEGKIIGPKCLELIIKGQGGLYIKELISGDEERTQPNVSQILKVKAQCMTLNVLEVGS